MPRGSVQGLAKLQHWTGKESFHRSIFDVPAPIVAYNMFMNSVDRLDQYRSTNPTQRKERRLQMTIFTLFLDLAVSQALAVYNQLMLGDAKARKWDFRVFKRHLCSLLVSQLSEKD
jgi:hypothetical protein